MQRLLCCSTYARCGPRTSDGGWSFQQGLLMVQPLRAVLGRRCLSRCRLLCSTRQYVEHTTAQLMFWDRLQTNTLDV